MKAKKKKPAVKKKLAAKVAASPKPAPGRELPDWYYAYTDRRNELLDDAFVLILSVYTALVKSNSTKDASTWMTDATAWLREMEP